MMVWLNGEWKEEADARISMQDRGFLRGLGVFETMLGLGGRVFELERHWERFAHGAERFGLTLPSVEEAEEISRELLQKNKLSSPHDRIRVRATRTPETFAMSASAETFPKRPHVVLTSEFRRNERSALRGLKALSYAENTLALAKGQAAGADEVLFVNTREELCEGSWSNVFLVEEGELFTPPLASGCLPGVTRAVVLELARELGLECHEEVCSLERPRDCEEIFLTSSLRAVTAIGNLDGRALWTGEITTRLAEALKLREVEACL